MAEELKWAAVGGKSKLHYLAKVGEDEWEQACTGTTVAGGDVTDREGGNRCSQCRSIEEKATAASAAEEAQAEPEAAEEASADPEEERTCVVHILIMGPRVARCRGVLVGPVEDGKAQIRTRHPLSGVEFQVEAEQKVGEKPPPAPWFELN